MILLRNIPLNPIKDGQLWISHYPGKTEIKDRLFQAEIDLFELKKKKIDIVVSLLEKKELEALQISTLFDLIKKNQFTHYYFPIEDKSVPKNKVELNRLLNKLCVEIHKNKKILLHCNAGLGRSGLIAALICRRLGISESPISYIRKYSPGSIETKDQENMITSVDIV
ncbi:dual specificity protein phosphatase family protein [Paracoccaceae bacterium]|nr:dual specificity protein phosphatase family protein [Paracoccaceae bacterium]